MAVAAPDHRFTVDEYERMAEIGILQRHHRVELIDGVVVDMTPVGPRHQAVRDRLNQDLILALRDWAIVRVRGSLRLDDYCEPETDLVILRRREDFYAAEMPGPADALLVIEVADTSERYDRQVKVPLYARAGIPEVWLVDLNGGTVTVYRQPGPDGYAQAVVATGSDTLSPLAFPDITLTVARILG